jgi:hypothetical protein
VHKRDKWGAGLERAGLRQCPERKPVENDRAASGHHGQHRHRVRAFRGAGEGEALSHVDNIHLPTEPPKLLDDASIISITSSRRGEIARHDERKARIALGSAKPFGFRESRRPKDIRSRDGPPLLLSGFRFFPCAQRKTATKRI